jgi:glyoxylase-like metal-dependent hydrolase (beta-lactamase superfamily II)
MKKQTPVLGNSQKLDGGAMFGHVPKAVWSKWLVPDEKNRITLACRALLIQEENRNILLETGIGAFFEPDLRVRYGVEEPQHVLLQSLASAGLTHENIDVVVLSHMHFDHAGGLLSEWKETETQTLLFPKAKYLVSKAGWERALHPHVRDKASFVPHLNELLKKSGRLSLVDSKTPPVLGADYEFLFSNGHTPGLMHTVVQMPESPVIFASDLIPGTSWVHLPVTMGYDRAPELLIDEKKKMLDYAIKKNAKLFFTHDPLVAMSHVQCDASGKYSIKK